MAFSPSSWSDSASTFSYRARRLYPVGSVPYTIADYHRTVWASNKTAYTYFRIDTASTPGYITA